MWEFADGVDTPWGPSGVDDNMSASSCDNQPPLGSFLVAPPEEL